VTGDNHQFAPGEGRDGVYQQLGPIHYGTEGPGNEGCLTKQVGNARTYRLPDTVNTTLFADVQQYDNHQIPSQHPVPGFRTYLAINKYLAIGARCAR
jgi:hypothetical protein